MDSDEGEIAIPQSNIFHDLHYCYATRGKGVEWGITTLQKLYWFMLDEMRLLSKLFKICHIFGKRKSPTSFFVFSCVIPQKNGKF